MILLKPGRRERPPQWWVQRVGVCSHCGAHMQVQRDDAVVEHPDKPDIVTVRCMECSDPVHLFW